MVKKKPSLHFVKAINVELTYECNMSCPHCLQHEFRKQGANSWVNTESVIRCMKEGQELGFTDSGVNFTGGEPFLGGSNLPERLKAAKCLGLDVRVNTNGWWGGRQDINIGSEYFSSGRQVVKWLKRQDIALLALSLDQRYERNVVLLNSVLSVMQECEEQGLYYQLIHTRSLQTESTHFWQRLEQEKKIRFDYMIPVNMEMVDLGEASGSDNINIESQMHCGGKGFYRPQFLHVNPSGGARTCMYASGSSWLGNINHESLNEIADKFYNNVVVEFFSSNCDARSNLVEQIYSRKDNHLPKHPCALAVKIAKDIELKKK
ncbi:radical SAM protein [Desulfopila aestuarii]|uniref:4Fe-4S single cluster domain-containing protein n=1 Tax=Desulfopila aestuarii DSM 18488 TaxID=1121416 RepID=A0A1M7Y9B3_9BACT|nr:radical SAM protein [Desulfopila aestuarii]SHO49210.1 4Fe-4S single cluster domain-containing protein [Desulfopila aestuarii DSM 18488]